MAIEIEQMYSIEKEEIVNSKLGLLIETLAKTCTLIQRSLLHLKNFIVQT